MDGVRLAPDGSKVAMILTRLLATDPDNAVGLWLVDTSGDAPPTQLADGVAFQAAQPSWSGLPVRPRASRGPATAPAWSSSPATTIPRFP
ncbi:MAG: hypothetical protein R2838_13765 [Caldilineaceae bacterium]